MSVDQTANRLEVRAKGRSQKREKKRRQIAEGALEALMTFGCSGTTLRDIAESSNISLGILHYYFEDRRDLVVYCLRLYREEFLSRFERLISAAESRDDIIDALAAGLADAVIHEPVTNRFWYDIRTRAMFDPAFLQVVDEFETELMDLGRRVSDRLEFATSEIELRFAMLEGVFRYHAQRQITGTCRPYDEMKAAFAGVLQARLNPMIAE